MPRLRIGNIPKAALRWSVERAGVEFGMSSHTLRKALAKESIVCGADQCFSTSEICRAVFGGLAEEKLATQRQLTRKYQLENSIVEASVLDRAALTKGFAAIADAVSSRIMSSELSREAKEDLLRELATIPIVVEDMAARQTRLPRRSKNGEKPDGENKDAKITASERTPAI